ncbi:polymer-forming cytoskeletal protein [Lacinutrix sp. Hel_I_90]|uniref:bactofilin family protein n=1 Tax=Lacinutrix sp. Hel_I_90 TaxID=1249999 RepID=UPI0005C88185|nr:polymer-forming cytoskeletal protein [Lacinutrix sp. Hel_I_90]
MFPDSKKSKTELSQNSVQNLIAKGTKIVGTFESEGDIRIDGIVEGEVRTPGKVVVGKTGEIHGSLQSSNAYFEGTLKGKLILTETLTLKPSANIEGEVVIAKLAIEPGAIFNVTCDMKNTTKGIKGDSKTEKTTK